RHAHVHQDHMREQPLCQLGRFGTVGCLGDDVDVFFGVQDHAEAVAHERLVVAEQHADRHWLVDANGSRAATRNPPVAIGSASTCPPKAAARSCIPIRPWPPAPLPDAQPVPSSTISTPRASTSKRIVTVACCASAWRMVLVSASCTIR